MEEDLKKIMGLSQDVWHDLLYRLGADNQVTETAERLNNEIAFFYIKYENFIWKMKDIENFSKKELEMIWQWFINLPHTNEEEQKLSEKIFDLMWGLKDLENIESLKEE